MYSERFLKKYKLIQKKEIGWVYIFKIGDKYKIGKTKNDPKKRMKQLSISESAEIYFQQKYENYHHREKEFHLLMKDKRIGNSEWFDNVNEEDLSKLKEWKKDTQINED